MKIRKINDIVEYSGKFKKGSRIVFSDSVDKLSITVSAMREIVDNLEKEGLEATIDKLGRIGIHNKQFIERDLIMRAALVR